ncbi:MAG TPA: beta-ketoacyl synthase N-terminal-like domain-containing protein [Steroidobacteraceae bacterium]
MESCALAELAITGVGVTSAIGQGKERFTSALLGGASAFRVMQRPGRQKDSAFLGAEISALERPPQVSERILRTLSFTSQIALATLQEAWDDARVDAVDPCRVGLIVGGSNVQQRELVQTYEAYAQRTRFLRPTYGLSFMDTDLCGVCTQQFGIAGTAYTVGGASASGQVAIILAAQAVQTGQVDVCIALGSLMDLSYWECQGLRSLGAMGSDRYANEPGLASRPFDRDTDGFIYGECCGAVVVEAVDSATRPGVQPYARLSGWGMVVDANRNPAPSVEGEARALQAALRRARTAPGEVDYINPHGTGSQLGDTTELAAIRAAGLAAAYLNATKSLVGHGLTAAGTVEVVATLLQMRAGRLHPTRNLDIPIDPGCNWVRSEPIAHRIETAVTLSMGFGGFNTALCLHRYR